MPWPSKTSSDRRATALVAGGVLALGGLALLTCCGPDAEPRDAGVARDGGPDGGALDAGRDAGRPRDAGRDADAARPPPAWRPLEGLPEGCDLSIATDPESVLGPLRFEPCPDLEGCRQLVVDWPRDEPPRINIVTGTHDGEHGYFAFARGEDPGWGWVVVARDDGRVLTVVRSPMPGADCVAFNVAVTANRAALTVATSGGGGIGDSVVGLLEWGEGPPTYRVLATLTPAFLGPNNYVQELEIGDDFVAGQVVPRYDVVRVGFDGSARWVTGAETGSPVLEAGAADALFYMTLPGAALWTAAAGDAGRVLWAPPDAAVGGIEADGTDLVWAQMYEPENPHRYARVELWTAPFTTDPALLSPRRVGEVPVQYLGGNLLAGYGHAAIGESNSLLSVYSLERGRIGVLRPPPDTEWRGGVVAFFGPEELAVMPRRLRTHPPESSTLRIIRYDALSLE